MQTIFPILRYNEARAAIRRLGSAFGFVRVLALPESGDYVRHGQLKLGKNLLTVGSVRANDGIVSLGRLGSAMQMGGVYVEDPDAHVARKQPAALSILCPPATADFGSCESQVLGP